MVLNITDYFYHTNSLTCSFRGKTKCVSVLAKQTLKNWYRSCWVGCLKSEAREKNQNLEVIKKPNKSKPHNTPLVPPVLSWSTVMCVLGSSSWSLMQGMHSLSSSSTAGKAVLLLCQGPSHLLQLWYAWPKNIALSELFTVTMRSNFLECFYGLWALYWVHMYDINKKHENCHENFPQYITVIVAKLGLFCCFKA